MLISRALHGNTNACVTGYQSAPEPGQNVTSSLHYHEFAVPQHPGNTPRRHLLAGVERYRWASVTPPSPSDPQDSSCTPEESRERGSASRNGTAPGRRTAWRVPSTSCRGRAQRSGFSRG